MTALLIGGSSDAAADPVNNDMEAPIKNYHVISERLGTGGTLSADAVGWLAVDGYQMIIDLRDEFDEIEANAALAEGTIYVHIPVSWHAPSDDELEAFLLVMAANPEKKILVHCSANYRASAMTYLYHVLELHTDPEEAMADVRAIWEPNETWQRFIVRSIDRRESVTE
ncbi:MAG: protein tyrosine phosphatase family protein [Gammaproteobacteria bacterium]|nr:protein tyrosine phosphatase family protein [Gammaproteobacteria bacterium]MCZ6717407.1 protein tyrosine phosphatase family protein [Gammaproteobacteria bacterium]